MIYSYLNTGLIIVFSEQIRSGVHTNCIHLQVNELEMQLTKLNEIYSYK